MTIQQLHHLFRVKLDRLDNEYYANILATEIDMFLNDAQSIFIKKRIPTNQSFIQSFEENQKRQNDLREITTGDVQLTLSSDQTGKKPDSFLFDLPSNYLYPFLEEAEIAYTDCNNLPVTERKGFIGITHSEYLLSKEDPFFIPTELENFGVRLLSNNKIEALTFGNFSINYYFMRYIRRPNEMQYSDNTVVPSGSLNVGFQYKVLSGTITHNGSALSTGQVFIAQNPTYSGVGTVALNGVDCELSVEAQREIVDIAVNLALDVIESPRAQAYKLKVIEQQ